MRRAAAGRADLAETLERALLDRGFETVLVDYRQVKSESRRSVLATLWNLGLVILVWRGERLAPRDRGLLERISGEFCFEVSVGDAADGLSSGFGNALKVAETLRIERRAAGAEES